MSELADEGDKACVDIFKEVSIWLGVGISMLIHIFEPRLILIGGGISHAGEKLLESCRYAVAKHVSMYFKNYKIQLARFQEGGVVIGATGLF